MAMENLKVKNPSGLGCLEDKESESRLTGRGTGIKECRFHADVEDRPPLLRGETLFFFNIKHDIGILRRPVWHV